LKKNVEKALRNYSRETFKVIGEGKVGIYETKGTEESGAQQKYQ
jgi:hypothetical protein